jgi:hypothetical protein
MQETRRGQICLDSTEPSSYSGLILHSITASKEIAAYKEVAICQSAEIIMTGIYSGWKFFPIPDRNKKTGQSEL